MESWKWKLWKRLSKTPEGANASRFWFFVKVLLFPVQYLRWRWTWVTPHVREDFSTGTVYIYGQKYTREFLEAMGEWPEGVVFLWTRHDGRWVVRRFDPSSG